MSDLMALAMPPSITIEMAKGFSLYMVKAILSGHADEIRRSCQDQFMELSKRPRPAPGRNSQA
jgi:hypothetical protein